MAFNATLLFEGGYKACLEYELPKHGIAAHRQETVPIEDRDRASCWLARKRKRYNAEDAEVSRSSQSRDTAAYPSRPQR